MPRLLLQMLLTVGWTVFGVMLIYAGARLFDRLAPIDYRAEIRKGNLAAGVVMAAVILAIASVVVVVIAT